MPMHGPEQAAASKKKLFPLFSRAPARGIADERPADSDASEAFDDARASRSSSAGVTLSEDTLQCIHDDHEQNRAMPVVSVQGPQNRAITSTLSKQSTRKQDGAHGLATQSRKTNGKASSSQTRSLPSGNPKSTLMRDARHTSPDPLELGQATRSSQSGRNVIIISDSPIRESAPFAAPKNVDRLVKRPRTSLGTHASGPLATWPSAKNVHVKYEVNDTIVASTSRSTIEDQLRALRKHSQIGIVPLRREGSPAPMQVNLIHNYAREASAAARKHSDSSGLSREDITRCLVSRGTKNIGAPTDDSHSQLPTQFRAPARAQDVIGERSRSSAIFLRDWLREQALPSAYRDSGTAGDVHNLKRKVQRGLTDAQRKRAKKEKRRARRVNGKAAQGASSDIDDFIVSDHESEEDDHASTRGGESDAFTSPTKSQTSRSASHAVSEPRALFNAILLTGPVGSGKTSSVYAAANELEWQVFEVYPGIGPRGQRELDRLIGMVGSNHIVHRQTTSLFSSVSNGVNGADVLEINDANPTVRQSLLLIEEVDVLYASDAGFCDALCAFIADSRRPVVMTCNDVDAVPLSRLALQAILPFEQPTLQTLRVALLEASDDVANVTDEPSLRAQVDVRAALMQLHFDNSCGTIQSAETGASSHSRESPSLRSAAAASDLCSYADAHLARRAFMKLHDEEQPDAAVGDYMAGHSENSFIQIQDIPRAPPERCLPCFGRESEFVEYLTGDPNKTATNLPSTRIKQLDQFYQSIVNMTGHIGADSTRATLTLPYLQLMVGSDDVLESVWREALAAEEEEAVSDARVRRSRRLAKSSNTEYPRYKGIELEAVQMIRDSTLRWECT